VFNILQPLRESNRRTKQRKDEAAIQKAVLRQEEKELEKDRLPPLGGQIGPTTTGRTSRQARTQADAIPAAEAGFARLRY